MLELQEEHLRLPGRVVRLLLGKRRIRPERYEDMLGVASLALVEAAHAYDPCRIGSRGPGPGPYLVQRVRWALFGHISLERRRVRGTTLEGFDLPDDRCSSPETAVLARDLEDRLSERIGTAWNLWKQSRVQGLSFAEIGRSRGESEHRVRRAVERAEAVVFELAGRQVSRSAPRKDRLYYLADHAGKTLEPTGTADLREALRLAGVDVPEGADVEKGDHEAMSQGWYGVPRLLGRVLTALADGGPRTVGGIQTALGSTSANVYRAVRDGIGAGLIETGKGFPRVYCLTSAARASRGPVWQREPVTCRRLEALRRSGYTVLA